MSVKIKRTKSDGTVEDIVVAGRTNTDENIRKVVDQKIKISKNAPTASDGANGDIWIQIK